MALLSQLRRELRFNAEFLQLLQTLKNIAASQYHMLEKEKVRFAQFMDAFGGFFEVVDLVGVQDPLVRAAAGPTGVVLVTSDSGFMGGLNAGVIEAGLAIQGTQADAQFQFVVIGERGAMRMTERGRTFRAFPGVSQESRYEQALDIRDYLVHEVLEGRMGRVMLVYPHPVSFTQQRVETLQLLPCGELFESSAVKAALESGSRKVVVESAFRDMVQYLAGTWVASKLYEVFEDSKLAEYAARAMHLEDSVQKLEQEHKKLKHQCFRSAHEAVDKSMRESFAGRRKKKQVA